MAKTISGTSEVLFHEIQWYFRTDGLEHTSELEKYLREEAESRAKHDISAGYVSGELCFSGLVDDNEVECFGWWTFAD